MPLYEYECLACKRHTEKIQKFSDPEITTCPHCSGELKRVISAPAFSLKGSGWFADGYGNAKPPAAASDSAPSNGSDSTAAPAAKDSAPSAAATPAAAPASTPAPAPASSSDKK